MPRDARGGRLPPVPARPPRGAGIGELGKAAGDRALVLAGRGCRGCGAGQSAGDAPRGGDVPAPAPDPASAGLRIGRFFEVVSGGTSRAAAAEPGAPRALAGSLRPPACRSKRGG